MKVKNIIKSNKILYRILIFILNKQKKYRFKLLKVRFKYSLHYKKIKKLKNIHKGKRCFIVGNGPSLNSKDLDKIKNEISFASNKIFLMFNKTEWRPTYYCCADFSLGKDIIKEINNIKVKEKFIPFQNPYFYDNNKIKSAQRILVNYDNTTKFPQNFSLDISKEVCCGATITYIAIQIAIYMGFKEIYLIGVDNNYSIYKDIYGNIIKDMSVKNYFSEEYNSSDNKKNYNIGNLGISNISYETANKIAIKKDIKIYNATRGGKLEIFERVNFDNIDFN